MANELTDKLRRILYDNWENRPAADKLDEAKKALEATDDISEEEAEILYGWKDLEGYFFDKKGLEEAVEFYQWLIKKFPARAVLFIALADCLYEQGKKEEATKLLLDAYEKDPAKTSKAPAELNESLHSHADQQTRVKYWAAILRGIEQGEGARAARKEYHHGLKERLPKEDWLALWKYLTDKNLGNLIKSPHQPEYLIVYDGMWDRIIESYFIRKQGIPEEDEPDDTANGPIEEEQAQDFIAFLQSQRYPERERFKIRTVNADSMESVMADIKWVVDED